MNRKEEYSQMLRELDRPVPELEDTLNRAYRKRKKRTAQYILRPAAGLAACFVVFVLLVNFCVPVAYACSLIPGLRELASAVTFSQSLTDAVENDYVQPMNLSRRENDITATIEYLIVDQKQVNIFYRLYSDKYQQLTADPDIRCDDENIGFAVVSNGWGQENGQLLSVTVDFVNGNVPDHLQCTLRVYSSGIEVSQAPAEEADPYRDIPEEPSYLADLEFTLEFDPQYTATGKVFPVNQTVILEGQAITITSIEVYPTHLRVEIGESEENSAWLKSLDFYIETDWGMKFAPVSSGITATGSENSKSMVSYRADSTYFYDARHLKLVISGAQWLRKDMEKTYLNLVTGVHGAFPEGASLEKTERTENGWIVTIHSDWTEDASMYQNFGHLFYDADGKEYEINQWSCMHGERNAEGEYTYFIDEFPLKNYPYDEVWLSPQFSHNWIADDKVVIPVF